MTAPVVTTWCEYFDATREDVLARLSGMSARNADIHDSFVLYAMTLLGSPLVDIRKPIDLTVNGFRQIEQAIRDEQCRVRRGLR